MERYQRSTEWLHKTESVIPTASQTFSKSHYSLPKGAAPLFLEEGSGAYVTDIDGNRYIDLVNGLLCVSLGYQHPAVDINVHLYIIHNMIHHNDASANEAFYICYTPRR